jgi:hypothetical protein
MDRKESLSQVYLLNISQNIIHIKAYIQIQQRKRRKVLNIK